MSLGMHDNTETSVMVSLNELVALEKARVDEERVERQRVSEEAARIRHEAMTRARVAEEQRKADDARARADVARQHLDEQTRLEGLRQAEVERARVEAQALVDRELAQARHVHEREMLRLASQRNSGALRSVAILGAVVTVLLAGGAAIGAITFTGSIIDFVK